MSEEASGATEKPLKRTALFELHQKLGARLVPYAGWEMPVQFSGVKAEHLATRQAIGLFDVSHMGELRVQGSGALEAVNRLITNDLGKAKDGQAVYTCCCNEAGTILDDLIVYRLSESEILIVCNAANLTKIREHFQQQLQSSGSPGSTTLTDESSDVALIAVQGPKALPLIERTLGFAVAGQLKPFRIASLQFAGSAIEVARTGYTGELGVEIFCPNASAPQLYERLLSEGAADGALPVGLAARDTLRLEARLALYGNDISESTNPLEAGLGWTVKFTKPDFVGKAALESIRDQGPTRQLVGFEMSGRGIARHGYPLLDEAGRRIGECTSGAPAPSLNKNIGLGYLPSGMTKVGTEFVVDCRGRSVGARVVETPFYKRSP